METQATPPIQPMTIGDILAHHGLRIPGAADDLSTLLGSMLQAMGATLDTDAEDVALLSPQDIQAIKDDWKLLLRDGDQRAPTRLEAVSLDKLAKRARAMTSSPNHEEAIMLAAMMQQRPAPVDAPSSTQAATEKV